MKRVPILIAFIFLSSSGNGFIPVTNKHQTNSKVLIMNAFDASRMNTRNKKKELFAKLSDSLTRMLVNDVQSLFNAEGIIHSTLITGPNRDSVVFAFIKEYKADRAIVIDTMNVFFKQTRVEVTKDKDGKSRAAFYDICAFVRYNFYDTYTRKDSRKTENCKFFTERNTMSGFLSVGPDVVGKSKYAFSMLEENAKQYLGSVSTYIH